jgi:predicted nucleic acid-binding Zn ribbon protein
MRRRPLLDGPARGMGPGTEQGGFAFFESRPLCRRCGVRSARPCPPKGFYRLCRRCWETGRQHDARRPRSCRVCGQPATYGKVACSARCQGTLNRRGRQHDKQTVLRALGHRCSCPGLDCWHVGPCQATHLEVLTVDHVEGNGHLVRRRRRDGTLNARTNSGQNWRRYRQELQAGTAHVRCLCHNCHHLGTALLSRQHLPSTATTPVALAPA